MGSSAGGETKVPPLLAGTWLPSALVVLLEDGGPRRPRRDAGESMVGASMVGKSTASMASPRAPCAIKLWGGRRRMVLGVSSEEQCAGDGGTVVEEQGWGIPSSQRRGRRRSTSAVAASFVPPKLPPSLPSVGAREGVKYAGPTPADGGVPPFLRIRRILPLVGRGALVRIGKGYMSLKSNWDSCSDTKAPPFSPG
jgi:hypothetical protein